MSKEYYQSLMIPPKLIIFLSIASSFLLTELPEVPPEDFM